MESKNCTKCSELKSLIEFNKSKRSSDGRSSECKDCERIRKGSTKRKTKVKQINGVDTKECTTCAVAKPTTEFFSQASNANGISSRCKECHYASNVTWRKDNVEKRRVIDQRRIARKADLPDTLTQEQTEAIREHFAYGCALTGTSDDIHLDHVIPINAGYGGTVRENIIPLRADINQSKSDRNIFDWYEAKGDKFGIVRENFDALIGYLAEVNGMTIEGYREYTYNVR